MTRLFALRPVVLVFVRERVVVLVVEGGVNVPDAPVGRPVTEKSTEPANPPEGVTVTTYVVEAPCTTFRAPGLTEMVNVGPGATPSARAAFSRPPVIVFPERLGMGSVLARIALLTWAVVRPGVFARTSAATPETCGAAMEVPLRYW